MARGATCDAEARAAQIQRIAQERLAQGGAPRRSRPPQASRQGQGPPRQPLADVTAAIQNWAHPQPPLLLPPPPPRLPAQGPEEQPPPQQQGRRQQAPGQRGARRPGRQPLLMAAWITYFREADVKEVRVMASRHVLPRMDAECAHCHAMHWMEERVSSPVSAPHFSMCCGKGKICLPLLQAPPQPLLRLFGGQNPQAKAFLASSRACNSAFSMASSGRGTCWNHIQKITMISWK